MLEGPGVRMLLSEMGKRLERGLARWWSEGLPVGAEDHSPAGVC